MRVKELIEHLQCFDPELFVEFEYWDSDEGHLRDDVDGVRLIPPVVRTYKIKRTGEERTVTEPAVVRLS